MTAMQGDLFAVEDLVRPKMHPSLSNFQRWVAFRDANVWLLPALERLTDEWLRSGSTRLGIATLFETLRWKASIANPGSDYGLNNSYRSHAVRDLIERRPDLADVFETRTLRAA